MPNRSIFLLALVLCLPLRAQQDAADGPIKMNPELALAIPLVLHGHDVTVKFPILINRTEVIKPGMILRNVYVPTVHDDSENLGLAHKGDMSEAYARSTMSSDEQAKMPADLAHEIETQRRVIWEVPINFQLALAQLPTDSAHVIYSSSGDNRNLQDERIDFYDGLFLGSPTGHVTVLAVEIGSKADAAGFKAGDDILAVANTPMPDDVGAFPNIYVAAHQYAQDSHATSIPMTVRPAGSATTRILNLPMPPSIKSQLMDGFGP